MKTRGVKKGDMHIISSNNIGSTSTIKMVCQVTI